MENRNTGTKVYLIGSKLNNIESLIVRDSNASALIHFNSLEEAKVSFNQLYSILLAPSFQPSIPPSAEELKYHQQFMMLMTFYPVVLEFERVTVKEHLLSWRKKKRSIFCTQEKFFSADYWHCPMRSGFLKEFGVLDVTKDIETTPFIGPDGNMVIRVNEISISSADHSKAVPKPISQEEIDKILRERGYL
ncbi:hypothetical protein [Niabella sp.]|uniref:hypothetical protein n=1 Tax=Niabella sp. TaxID=1962976 RepID=UPI002607C103|nr:hypothetical protein [Niabella sp.]